MLKFLSLINSLIGLSLYILIGLPIVIFIIYILATVGSSFFGGPTWLWFIITSILLIPAAKEGLDKAKLKNQTKNEA